MPRHTCSVIMLVASSVFAADKPHCSGPSPSAEPKPVDAAFERFKRLVGDWEIASPNGEARPGKIHARYHLTAGGSAVVETVFPGEDLEMVTVYHRDGDQLMLTHYCHVGNQPRMRTKAVASAGELAFDLVGGSNLEPGQDTHMHRVRIRFVDEDHFHTEWQLYRQGKAADLYQFDLVRKKS